EGGDEEVAILTRARAEPRPLAAPLDALGDTTREALATFELIREALAREPESIGCYIVSMTHELSDMLEPLLLAKVVGLWTPDRGAPLDFVPLFETIEGLAAVGDRLGALLAHPAYAAQLEGRGRFQEIMLGYADSNKDGGYWMANWALHRAQERIGR